LKKHYREPPGEEGDHPCPKCKLLPHERDEKSQEDSYSLAEEFVLEQIADQVDVDVTMVTVGELHRLLVNAAGNGTVLIDMCDCDCIPVTVHYSALVRWDLVSVADVGRKLLATYEMK
jgi:hypothetical protein